MPGHTDRAVLYPPSGRRYCCPAWRNENTKYNQKNTIPLTHTRVQHFVQRKATLTLAVIGARCVYTILIAIACTLIGAAFVDIWNMPNNDDNPEFSEREKVLLFVLSLDAAILSYLRHWRFLHFTRNAIITFLEESLADSSSNTYRHIGQSDVCSPWRRSDSCCAAWMRASRIYKCNIFVGKI